MPLQDEGDKLSMQHCHHDASRPHLLDLRNLREICYSFIYFGPQPDKRLPEPLSSNPTL